MLRVLKIHVHVQGVLYRKTICEKVQTQLPGLIGIIQNLPDGSVEIIVDGPEKEISLLLDVCYAGSSDSKVEYIEFHVSNKDYQFESFKIQY